MRGTWVCVATVRKHAALRAAYDATIKACEESGSDPSVIASRVTELMNSTASNAAFVRTVLASRGLK